MKKRFALYPGTFDPVTLGHVDIIQRGAKLFDRLMITVAVNIDKKPLFSIEQRVRFLEESVGHLPGVEVVPMQGLLVEFARQQGANAILRGLRAISDFEFEFQMAAMNRQLAPDVETVFLMASESATFLSSRLVKEVALMGGDVSPFVPPQILPELLEKVRKTNQLAS